MDRVEMASAHPDGDPVEDSSRPILGAIYRRAVARALDMFTVLFIEFAIVLLGLWWVMDAISTNVDPQPWGRAFAATVLYVVVAAIYEILFLTTRGQTPGKDLLNLKVVDRATGEAPSLAMSVRRTAPFLVLRMVPGAFLGSLVVGAMCPVGSSRLSIADRIANTMVIEFDADEADDDADDDGGTDGRGLDRDRLAATYGPRSLRDYLARWTRN